MAIAASVQEVNAVRRVKDAKRSAEPVASVEKPAGVEHLASVERLASVGRLARAKRAVVVAVGLRLRATLRRVVAERNVNAAPRKRAPNAVRVDPLANVQRIVVSLTAAMERPASVVTAATAPRSAVPKTSYTVERSSNLLLNLRHLAN